MFLLHQICKHFSVILVSCGAFHCWIEFAEHVSQPSLFHKLLQLFVDVNVFSQRAGRCVLNFRFYCIYMLRLCTVYSTPFVKSLSGIISTLIELLYHTV